MFNDNVRKMLQIQYLLFLCLKLKESGLEIVPHSILTFMVARGSIFDKVL